MDGDVGARHAKVEDDSDVTNGSQRAYRPGTRTRASSSVHVPLCADGRPGRRGTRTAQRRLLPARRRTHLVAHAPSVPRIMVATTRSMATAPWLGEDAGRGEIGRGRRRTRRATALMRRRRRRSEVAAQAAAERRRLAEERNMDGRGLEACGWAREGSGVGIRFSPLAGLAARPLVSPDWLCNPHTNHPSN
jgi:hypothetical protein